MWNATIGGDGQELPSKHWHQRFFVVGLLTIVHTMSTRCCRRPYLARATSYGRCFSSQRQVVALVAKLGKSAQSVQERARGARRRPLLVPNRQADREGSLVLCTHSTVRSYIVLCYVAATLGRSTVPLYYYQCSPRDAEPLKCGPSSRPGQWQQLQVRIVQLCNPPNHRRVGVASIQPFCCSSACDAGLAGPLPFFLLSFLLSVAPMLILRQKKKKEDKSGH